MFFAKKIIFVEGIEDQAFILAGLEVAGLVEQFRKAGAHIIVTNGKSNLITPLWICNILEIDHFVVFDGDSSTDEKHGRRDKQMNDNIQILKILQLEKTINHFPDQNVFSPKIVFWKENIGEAFNSDCGSKKSEIYETVEAKHNHPGDLEKNILAIADRIQTAMEVGSELKSIRSMLNAIVEFCNT